MKRPFHSRASCKFFREVLKLITRKPPLFRLSHISAKHRPGEEILVEKAPDPSNIVEIDSRETVQIVHVEPAPSSFREHEMQIFVQQNFGEALQILPNVIVIRK